jgi:hypothetical protein
MVLARALRDQLEHKEAYEFFSGIDENHQPIWTPRVESRKPVFEHPNGCYRGGITYHPGLKRYLWVQILPQSQDPRGPRFQGGFGVYDAPEPWGPWTTVYFTRRWDVGPGETATFPAKWISSDGRKLHLVFSGEDHFSVREATLIPQAAPQRP